MTQNRHDLLDENFEQLLVRAAETATYKLPDDAPITEPLPSSIYRVIGGMSKTFEMFTGFTALPVLDDTTKAELEAWIRRTFGSYIEDDHIGITLCRFVSESDVVSVGDTALMLVKATLLLEVERVVELLNDWLSGVPVSYKTEVLIAGITVGEPISLTDAITLSPVTEFWVEEEMPTRLLESMTDTDQRLLPGATRLSIQHQVDQIGPLFKPDPSRVDRDEDIPDWEDEHAKLESCYRALSLACNSVVVPIIEWRDYADLPAVNTGTINMSSYPYLIGYDWRQFQDHGQTVSQDEASMAGDFLNKTVSEYTHPLGLQQPIGRWMKAKRVDMSIEDRLIELRIALEALYLEDSEGAELSYRLAQRCALRLGRDGAQRRRYRSDIKKVYGLASKAVHRGQANLKRQDERLFESTLDLIRQEILNRLNEGQRPDWDSVELGELDG